MRDDREEFVLEAIGGFGVLAGLFFRGVQPFAFLFGGLALGHVARNLGRADDTSGRVAHRRNRQRKLQQAAVLGAAHRFKMIDALAASNASQNVILLGPPLARYDQCNMFADRFVGAVAENALGRRVP